MFVEAHSAKAGAPPKTVTIPAATARPRKVPPAMALAPMRRARRLIAMPIDAHPTATRSTCERFWFALIVLARTASLPQPLVPAWPPRQPGDKGNHADPQPQLDQLTRYRPPAGDIPDGVEVFFRRVAQIRLAGCRLTSAPHCNAAANPRVGRQRRAADGVAIAGCLEGLVQSSLQGLLENGNVLLQR